MRGVSQGVSGNNLQSRLVSCGEQLSQASFRILVYEGSQQDCRLFDLIFSLLSNTNGLPLHRDPQTSLTRIQVTKELAASSNSTVCPFPGLSPQRSSTFTFQ